MGSWERCDDWTTLFPKDLTWLRPGTEGGYLGIGRPSEGGVCEIGKVTSGPHCSDVVSIKYQVITVQERHP